MDSLKGKLTEEEAYELSMCYRTTWEEDLKRLKKKGYIKQNPVKKAKEFLANFDSGYEVYSGVVVDELVEICAEAIEYIEKEKLS